MPKLSVIIVSFNVKYFLEQCLHTLIQATVDIESEIIVVDNNSNDNSVGYLQKVFKQIKFIRNNTNLGFGKACNQGLNMAHGEYILFLNPDTLLPEDCLQQTISYLDQHPDAGALGIRMVDGNGEFLMESKRGFPTPTASFYKLSGLSSLFPKSAYFSQYNKGDLSQHEIHPVEILSGAFLLVRKSVLDRSGGFDERFFMYGEDIDLSYRLQMQKMASGEKTYSNIYFGKNQIIHFKGESLGKGNPQHTQMFFDAMKLFAEKHFAKKYNPVSQKILETGINWKKRLTEKENTKIKNDSGASASEKKILVIGEARAFDGLKNILNDAGIDLSRVDFEPVEKEIEIHLSQIEDELETAKYQEVIFIIGLLKMKYIIERLQNIPAGINKKFHVAGSGSVVGSSDINQKGETYPGALQEL